MFQVGKNNPEYMAVLTETVRCLFHQLEHPKLNSPSASDLTEWFHHISEEEVQAALEKSDNVQAFSAPELERTKIAAKVSPPLVAVNFRK